MELVLNTFGTSLSRDNEGFVIKHKDGKQRIPTEGIKCIHVGRGAQITSDAVLLTIENEIRFFFLIKQVSRQEEHGVPNMVQCQPLERDNSTLHSPRML